MIPIAILGSNDFDINDIDIPTVSFAGLAVRVTGKADKTKCALEDVNSDGNMDLVCQFEDDSSAWEPGSGEATLTGKLFDETPFQGTDTICIVP